MARLDSVDRTFFRATRGERQFEVELIGQFLQGGGAQVAAVFRLAEPDRCQPGAFGEGNDFAGLREHRLGESALPGGDNDLVYQGFDRVRH